MPRADMEFLRILRGEQAASKTSPMAHETYQEWRDNLVKETPADVTIVVNRDSHEASCLIPRCFAVGGSVKIKEELQDAQSTKSIVSIDGFEYIVVEMVVQYLMKTEYNLDKRQKLENYTLEHLKKAAKDSDDGTITVKVEGGLTELHVKVYLCATYLKASVLQKVAFRNIRDTIRQERPTAEQFVEVLEKHKLFDRPEPIDEGFLCMIATYGASQRSRWLKEGGSKYLDFLGHSRYAMYEAMAESSFLITPANKTASNKRKFPGTSLETSASKTGATNPEQDERKPAFRPFFNTPSSRNQNQAYVEDDEDDSFIPHAASHSPQGPRWRRPRTAGNQGGDQPMTRQAINDLFASEEPTNSRNDDATDEGDATITELTTATEELDASSSHSVPAGEDVGDSTIISLIDSTEDSIDLDTSRGESSFQEQDTLTSVPAIQGLHVSAPSAAQVPSGLPQTGGGEVEPKEDVTMIDASKDLNNVEVTDKQEQ